MTEIFYEKIEDGRANNLKINLKDGTYRLVGRRKGNTFDVFASVEVDPAEMETERNYFEKYQHKGTVLQDPQDREFIFANSNITDSMETLVQDRPIAEKVQGLLRSNQGFTLEYLESQLNQKLAGTLQELQADFIIYETGGKYYTL